MGKKHKKLFVIIVAVVSTVLLCASTPATIHKVILPDTNLYQSADINSNVLATVPQNATVQLFGDSFQIGEFSWQKVGYNTMEGYLLTHDLYQSTTQDNIIIHKAKARSDKVGKDINLYVSHDISSKVGAVVHDGERVNVWATEVDYGEFVLVEYNGQTFFAMKSNVTTGLSLNQRLAVIIGGSAAAIAVILIIVLVSAKNRKLYKKTN